MENTYGEFQGTELDPSLDFDFDEDENDLLPILGLSALVAGVVGAALIMLGRRREPTVADRAQEILDLAGKQGKKGLAVATKAAEDVKLRDMLDDALKKAQKTTSNADLEDLLANALKTVQEASKRAEKAAGKIDAGETLRGVRKSAQVAGLAALLEDALDKVREASGRVDTSDIRDAARDAGKRMSKAVSKVELPEVDTDKTGRMLDDLRDRLVAAVESMRGDIAPRAVDAFKETVLPTVQEAAQNVAQRVQEDVLPPAQDAMGRLRDDVLPSAQETVSKFAEQYDMAGRARRAGAGARGGANSVGGLVQSIAMAVIDKMVQDILPEAKKAGNKAASVAREEVIPSAAKTASEAVHMVREDVLPRVGDAASKTPDLLSDILAMARERAAEAFDKASPAVADAAEYGKHRVGEAAMFGRHRAADVAASVQDNRNVVSKAASSAKDGVTGAVGSAVAATTYTAKETTGILWWLSMLGAIILLVFVPDRDRQEEFWNNTRQFLGEVREMWRDLQGPDEFDPMDNQTTSQ